MGRLKTLIRNINYLCKNSLYDQRENDIVFLTNKIVSDVGYEYSLNVTDNSMLNVLGKEESLHRLLETKQSFVRFCDGEINLMQKRSQPFQVYDEQLVGRLYDLLQNPRDNIRICINKSYFRPLKEDEYYNRRYAYEFRTFLIKNCNHEALYYDGAVTFWHVFGEHNEEANVFWQTWRQFFFDEKIAIVCGNGILDNLKYDVFELAKDKMLIYGPIRHAWKEHDKLVSEIVDRVPRDWKLVFILGMAGKAMIPEMVDKGYIAWDIGHLAKSYDAYMNNYPVDKEFVDRFYAPD